MKTNLPITQLNIDYLESDVFVTKTDPKGIITYANDAFVQISGFSREELVGKSHNVVRHPDMPEWAFADLWKTVKSGFAWRGLVKNRAKNGDHYWVRATISPIIQDSVVVGYLSLRKKPSPADISSTEVLYKGGVPLSSKLSIIKWFYNLSLHKKLQLLIQSVLFVLLSLATIMLFNAFKKEMVDSVKLRADGIANEVIDSANMLMVTGKISEVESRQLLIRKISSSGNIVRLRLMRAQQVINQFGPGLPEEQIKSDIEKQVIVSKQPYYALEEQNGITIFRTVTPYIVSHDFHGTDCLKCHAVEVGSVNGASNIEIDVTSDFKNLYELALALIVGQIFLQGFLFILIRWIAKRFVVKPVTEVKEHLQEIVNGDMTKLVDISTRDEMGEVLSAVQSTKVLLGSILSQITSVTKNIDEQAKYLTQSMKNVEKGSIAQTEAASSMSAAVEEISVSINQVSDNTKAVHNTSENSKHLASQGREIVNQVVKDMTVISQSVISTAHTIEQLGVKSNEIQNIVKTITEIADQTNLLALNAAIEAARAGEQGRGFAVVADEVRKLAEKTRLSTVEIIKMTDEIQGSTSLAVSEMQATVDKVKTGTVLTEKAGNSIIEIDEGASTVLAGVEQISNTIKEQNQVTKEIASNVEKVAQMTEQNSVSVNDVSATVNKLEKLSDELEKTVSQFRV
jgi:methyl-accepting chemotaxis protein/aerotaxis receptor